MYVSVIDHDGKTQFHRNMPTDSEHLEQALTPFLENLVVAVECVFAWYWIADYCADHGIDSQKIAALLRGGARNYPTLGKRILGSIGIVLD